MRYSRERDFSKILYIVIKKKKLLLYKLCKSMCERSIYEIYLRNILSVSDALIFKASPCIVLSASIFCAFSLCRKTYSISPPIFKYRIGVECKDIFFFFFLRSWAIFLRRLLSGRRWMHRTSTRTKERENRRVVLTT